MPITIEAPTLHVPTGPLTSVASLVQNVGEHLATFTRLYQDGAGPRVLWDLTELRGRRVNLSALTAFLALAYRMHVFTAEVPQIKLPDDPDLLDFLADISFFEIGYRERLWSIQGNRLQGVVKPGKTNPNSNIFIFDLPRIPDRQNELRFNQWKDAVRGEVKKELLLKCGPLFRGRSASNLSLQNLVVDELAITCAELVLNCVIHGQSPAFIGLQRSSARITVSVSDCGVGFQRTLQEQSDRATKVAEEREFPLVESDLAALVLGSLIRKRGYGVRRSIDMILRSGGWISMSSGNAEIQWRKHLWDLAIDALSSDYSRLKDPTQIFGRQTSNSDSNAANPLGYYREFKRELRGTRISFEIPLE